MPPRRAVGVRADRPFRVHKQLPAEAEVDDRFGVDGPGMTLLWLSPGLPIDRDALAADLGPSVQVATQAFPPPGTSLAVATVFERELLSRLASVPGAGATLLFRPPGTAAPQDLPRSDGPVELSEASDVADVSAAVRRMLDGGTAAWPSAAALVGAGVAAGAGAAPEQRAAKRRWLASGGVVAAAALAAVVVLATQGGASNTAATGFRGGGPGGMGGYGFAGPPGTAGGSSGSGVPTDGQRQAFLACLQENGVDTSAMTSGQRPRLDPSDPATAAAFQACRNLMPQRGPGRLGGHDPDGDGYGPGMPGGAAPGGTAPGGTAPGTRT